MFLKFVLHFALSLIRKNMYIYQATNTFLQSHNQLQNKNIHVNILFLAYGKCSNSLSG